MELAHGPMVAPGCSSAQVLDPLCGSLPALRAPLTRTSWQAPSTGPPLAIRQPAAPVRQYAARPRAARTAAGLEPSISQTPASTVG
ncbi:hypothetical protein HMPREF1550_01109 [Actinomyces sp. oral taxon 877 str. F0543]|nr:hypothetical protein HMPREF1550_01109 [Actinomyces sp. oral taxon 877 str. F0543]